MLKARWPKALDHYIFEHIQAGELDPSYLMTHTASLEDGPQGYAMFKHKSDDCLRVVFAP